MPAPPRRRWFRFRLRTLLALITFLCVALAWFANRLYHSSQQRDAVRILEEHGFSCNYAYHFDYNGNLIWDRVRSPNWLVQTFGIDFVSAPFWVTSTTANVSESAAIALGQLTSLTRLDLLTKNVSDDFVGHLSGLVNLQELELSVNPISDRALESFRNMSQLEYLTLECTKITGDGIRHLAHLPKLRILCLDGTRVGDEAVPYLRQMTQLERLEIDHCLFTPAGLNS